MPPTDLGKLVVALTPPKGFNQIGWDYLIDSPMVHWISDGVTITETSAALREGLVRVRIDGRLSTRIRQHREELAWTVTLGNWDGAKWGPKWIRLAPGAPQSGVCFGTLDDGCTFSAAEALSAHVLTAKHICKGGMVGGDMREVYSIAVPGGQPSLLVYETSGGSGGDSSNIEIRPMSDAPSVCKPGH